MTESTILGLDQKNKIGIAADHGGFALKEYLLVKLQEAGFEIIDFGNTAFNPDDDYPDYVIPLAKAVALGEVVRGIAICASGVGACIIANKIHGVRACLIHELFSARQGVEDDDMNLICLGGRVIEQPLAWELTITFLEAKFSGLERHLRRLAKMKRIEKSE
jgi:ribose 5-phosphate isomerase B